MKATVRLKRPHKAQQAILDSPARYKVVCCGRRFGKTETIIHRIAGHVLYGKHYGYFVPSYKYLLPAWNEVLRVFAPVISMSSKTDKLVHFITGGTFEAWTLQDDRAGQSRKYHEVGIDEAASVPNLLPIFNESIMPTLIDYQGRAGFYSTPQGRGDFWKLYGRGLYPERFPQWAIFNYSSYANPLLSTEFIDDLRTQMTERAFKQEIMAEFLEDAGAVFRGVRDVSTLPAKQRKRGKHSYVMGLDWGKQDYTVIVVFDRDTKKQVYMERFNEISWQTQRARVLAAYKRWQPFRIIAEQNSIGSPIIEQLNVEGMRNITPFTTTQASKAEIIESLALAIERGELTLINDETQIAELEAYELKRLPSGNYSYGAPSGLHDDTVMALALAWHGVVRSSHRFLL